MVAVVASPTVVVAAAAAGRRGKLGADGETPPSGSGEPLVMLVAVVTQVTTLLVEAALFSRASERGEGTLKESAR